MLFLFFVKNRDTFVFCKTHKGVFVVPYDGKQNLGTQLNLTEGYDCGGIVYKDAFFVFFVKNRDTFVFCKIHKRYLCRQVT